MDQKKPEYLVPALIGGAVAGVLTGVPIVSCLCCLWVIGGAVLAANLLAKNTPGRLTSGDGAIVGALTGIVAAVVNALVEIPFRPFNIGMAKRILDRMPGVVEDWPSGWDNLLQGSTEGVTAAWFILGLFIGAVIYAIVGILGGIIGVSLFGKKPAPSVAAPPAPPPSSGPADAA